MTPHARLHAAAALISAMAGGQTEARVQQTTHLSQSSTASTYSSSLQVLFRWLMIPWDESIAYFSLRFCLSQMMIYFSLTCRNWIMTLWGDVFCLIWPSRSSGSCKFSVFRFDGVAPSPLVVFFTHLDVARMVFFIGQRNKSSCSPCKVFQDSSAVLAVQRFPWHSPGNRL